MLRTMHSTRRGAERLEDCQWSLLLGFWMITSSNVDRSGRLSILFSRWSCSLEVNTNWRLFDFPVSAPSHKKVSNPFEWCAPLWDRLCWLSNCRRRLGWSVRLKRRWNLKVSGARRLETKAEPNHSDEDSWLAEERLPSMSIDGQPRFLATMELGSFTRIFMIRSGFEFQYVVARFSDYQMDTNYPKRASVILIPPNRGFKRLACAPQKWPFLFSASDFRRKIFWNSMAVTSFQRKRRLQSRLPKCFLSAIVSRNALSNLLSYKEILWFLFCEFTTESNHDFVGKYVNISGRTKTAWKSTMWSIRRSLKLWKRCNRRRERMLWSWLLKPECRSKWRREADSLWSDNTQWHRLSDL